MKRIVCLALAAALCLILTACSQPDPLEGMPNPIATITMENGDTMRFELYYDVAPNTVANFTKLANDGFYDGLEFYRVVPGVLIQSGDPTNKGSGRADYTIKGEFGANGFSNALSHARGVLSMARLENDMNSGSSQFFIMQGNYPEYDGSYAAFGMALDAETLTVIDSIATLPVDGYYNPLFTQTILTLRVNTHGFELPEPVTIPIPEE